MGITYLSHPLDENTPSYANRDEVILKAKSSISDGETANTTDIRITNNHIGTHIDVPKHFYDKGRTLTDVHPKEWFFKNPVLIDIPCEEGRLISDEDFAKAKIDKDVDFLILRTGFENFRLQDKYWNGYPGISEKACIYLRNNFNNLRAIGFDFISLTSPLFKEEGKKAHLSFLDESSDRGIFIIEDMKIAHLAESPEKVIVAPLLLNNGNGGPVTIIVYQDA